MSHTAPANSKPTISRPSVPRHLRRVSKLLLLLVFILSYIPLIAFILCCFAIWPFSRYYANNVATTAAYMQWILIDWMFRTSSSIEIPHIPKDNYLVISNHISAFDFTLINRVNTHMFQHSKYAFKDSLRYIPIVYQAFLALNCLILNRNFQKDKSNIVEYVKMVRRHRLSIWFVLFCEGTRYCAARKQQSDVFCRERGMEPFKHVLAPRYKGFDVLKSEFEGSHVRKVLDLTFYCENGEFSVLGFLFGSKHYRFRCDARVVDMASITDSEKFVIDAFRRKDKLIERWSSKSE